MKVEVTPYESISAVPTKEQPDVKNLLVIASTLVSAAVIVGYMSMVGLYLSERADVLANGETWLPDGVSIPLTQPNYMGLSIAFSLFTVWWTVSAVRNGDRSNAILAYCSTLLFSFGFIAQTFYLISLLEMPAAESNQAILIYSLIGVHLLLTVIGIGHIFVVALRTLVGDFSKENYEAVVSSAIFWTAIVILYSVLWYAVYITK